MAESQTGAAGNVVSLNEVLDLLGVLNTGGLRAALAERRVAGCNDIDCGCNNIRCTCRGSDTPFAPTGFNEYLMLRSQHLEELKRQLAAMEIPRQTLDNLLQQQ
jgi:hypothetical protein